MPRHFSFLSVCLQTLGLLSTFVISARLGRSGGPPRGPSRAGYGSRVDSGPRGFRSSTCRVLPTTPPRRRQVRSKSLSDIGDCPALPVPGASRRLFPLLEVLVVVQRREEGVVKV